MTTNYKGPIVYKGDGSTNKFPIGIPFFEAADIIAAITYPNGDISPLSHGTHYEVTGGQDGLNPKPQTGTICLKGKLQPGTCLTLDICPALSEPNFKRQSFNNPDLLNQAFMRSNMQFAYLASRSGNKTMACDDKFLPIDTIPAPLANECGYVYTVYKDDCGNIKTGWKPPKNVTITIPDGPIPCFSQMTDGNGFQYGSLNDLPAGILFVYDDTKEPKCLQMRDKDTGVWSPVAVIQQCFISTSKAQSAPENATDTGIVLTGTQGDGSALTPAMWSISGGVDAALFSIDATGQLVFSVAPDFETPTDADTNGVYEVIVTADDGTCPPVTQCLEVTVTDVDEFIASCISGFTEDTSSGGGPYVTGDEICFTATVDNPPATFGAGSTLPLELKSDVKTGTPWASASDTPYGVSSTSFSSNGSSGTVSIDPNNTGPLHAQSTTSNPLIALSNPVIHLNDAGYGFQINFSSGAVPIILAVDSFNFCHLAFNTDAGAPELIDGLPASHPSNHTISGATYISDGHAEGAVIVIPPAGATYIRVDLTDRGPSNGCLIKWGIAGPISNGSSATTATATIVAGTEGTASPMWCYEVASGPAVLPTTHDSADTPHYTLSGTDGDMSWALTSAPGSALVGGGGAGLQNGVTMGPGGTLQMAFASPSSATVQFTFPAGPARYVLIAAYGMNPGEDATFSADVGIPTLGIILDQVGIANISGATITSTATVPDAFYFWVQIPAGATTLDWVHTSSVDVTVYNFGFLAGAGVSATSVCIAGDPTNLGTTEMKAGVVPVEFPIGVN